MKIYSPVSIVQFLKELLHLRKVLPYLLLCFHLIFSVVFSVTFLLMLDTKRDQKVEKIKVRYWKSEQRYWASEHAYEVYLRMRT